MLNNIYFSLSIPQNSTPDPGRLYTKKDVLNFIYITNVPNGQHVTGTPFPWRMGSILSPLD